MRAIISSFRLVLIYIGIHFSKRLTLWVTRCTLRVNLGEQTTPCTSARPPLSRRSRPLEPKSPGLPHLWRAQRREPRAQPWLALLRALVHGCRPSRSQSYLVTRIFVHSCLLSFPGRLNQPVWVCTDRLSTALDTTRRSPHRFPGDDLPAGSECHLQRARPSAASGFSSTSRQELR